MRLPKILGTALVLAGTAVVHAQPESPTLARISETATFRIGFVPDAPPMSFLDANGNAVGYSIDLCRHIAASIRDALGLEYLELTFEPLVSMEQRLGAVARGAVDIECGATTVTLSRRQRVDFSLLTFITGGAVVSPSQRAIRSMQAIDGRSIAVIRDTTTETTLRNYVDSNEMDVEIAVIDTHEQGIDAITNGDVAGYASDHAMLVGLAYHRSGARDLSITSDIFSFEPYAMTLPRGDTAFRLAVDRALASLYRTARIRRIYHNWIGRYGLPMSPVVEAIFEFQAIAE